MLVGVGIWEYAEFSDPFGSGQAKGIDMDMSIECDLTCGAERHGAGSG
jgi:hypothetical protein